MDGIVRTVDFFVNADSIGTAPFPPFILNYPLPSYGAYTLQARAVDDDGSRSFSSPVQITAEPPSAVTVLPGSSGIQFELFPNPASGFLNIRFGSSKAATVSIQLANSLGQRVHSLETTLLPGATLRQLPVGHLPAGIYQLLVSCEEASGSRMVVVE